MPTRAGIPGFIVPASTRNHLVSGNSPEWQPDIVAETVPLADRCAVRFHGTKVRIRYLRRNWFTRISFYVK